jgi:hypothetical protein
VLGRETSEISSAPLIAGKTNGLPEILPVGSSSATN